MFWAKQAFTSDQLRHKPNFTNWDTQKLAKYQADINHFLIMLFYDVKSHVENDSPFQVGKHKIEIIESVKFDSYLNRQLLWYYDNHLVLDMERDDFYSLRGYAHEERPVTVTQFKERGLVEANSRPHISKYCYGEWSQGITLVRNICLEKAHARATLTEMAHKEKQRQELLAKLEAAGTC